MTINKNKNRNMSWSSDGQPEPYVMVTFAILNGMQSSAKSLDHSNL